jgi:hypothetical protein
LDVKANPNGKEMVGENPMKRSIGMQGTEERTVTRRCGEIDDRAKQTADSEVFCSAKLRRSTWYLAGPDERRIPDPRWKKPQWMAS